MNEDGLKQVCCKKSLWNIFYDCIQFYPKYKKLKEIIECVADEKNSFENEERKKELEKYFLKKIEE